MTARFILLSMEISWAKIMANILQDIHLYLFACQLEGALILRVLERHLNLSSDLNAMQLANLRM